MPRSGSGSGLGRQDDLGVPRPFPEPATRSVAVQEGPELVFEPAPLLAEKGGAAYDMEK